MNNQQEKLYKQSLVELKNIVNQLDNKVCTDATYIKLCKKLQSICTKLQQNKQRPHKKESVSINEFFADGWPEGSDY